MGEGAQVIQLFGERTLQHSASEATLRAAEFTARMPPDASPDDMEAASRALSAVGQDPIEELAGRLADERRQLEQELENMEKQTERRGIGLFTLAALVVGGWVVLPFVLVAAVGMLGWFVLARMFKKRARKVQ